MIEDIYGDLDNFDVGQSINELEIKNKALTEQIDHLTKSLDIVTKEVDEVKKINKQLQENISKLFNTAKTELERKANMIVDLRKQLDDLLFKRIKPGNNYKIPKKRKLNENVIDDADNVKKAKLDDEAVPLEKEMIESKEKNIENKKPRSPKPSNRYNNRNNKFNRRSRDRSVPRKHYRSRTRSRERNRRSPLRSDHHRVRRDRRNRSRDNSRDRRIHSPDRRIHSPDRRTHSPNRRYHSPDNEQRSYDVDRKSYIENFKKRELERNSDSESVISIKSTSSHEDVMLVSDRKDKKNFKKIDVKQTAVTNIKTKESHDSEIEEGEISDDGSETTVELKDKDADNSNKDHQNDKPEKYKEKDRIERKNSEKDRGNEKHKKDAEKHSGKDTKGIETNGSNKNDKKSKPQDNHNEKDNLRKVEQLKTNEKSDLRNKRDCERNLPENEQCKKGNDKLEKQKKSDIKSNQDINDKEKMFIKTEKIEESNQTYDQENIENNYQENKDHVIKKETIEQKEKTDRIKNKQLLLFGNDSSIDFESTLMGYSGKSELEDIQKFIEDQIQNESDKNNTKSIKDKSLSSECNPSNKNDTNIPQINFKFESPKSTQPNLTERLESKSLTENNQRDIINNTNPLENTSLRSSTPNSTSVDHQLSEVNLSSVPMNLTTQTRNLSELSVNSNVNSLSITKNDPANPEPSNLPQKKPVRRRRCILTIQ